MRVTSNTYNAKIGKTIYKTGVRNSKDDMNNRVWTNRAGGVH